MANISICMHSYGDKNYMLSNYKIGIYGTLVYGVGTNTTVLRWTGKSIAVHFYTEIPMLARGEHNRMAYNFKITEHFDNMWINACNEWIY